MAAQATASRTGPEFRTAATEREDGDRWTTSSQPWACHHRRL